MLRWSGSVAGVGRHCCAGAGELLRGDSSGTANGLRRGNGCRYLRGEVDAVKGAELGRFLIPRWAELRSAWTFDFAQGRLPGAAVPT